MNEIVKKTTLLFSLLIAIMLSASIFLAPVFASDQSMSITAPSSSEEDEEIIFDIVAPYEMAEQQGGLIEAVPLEIPLTADPDNPEIPGIVPMPGTTPLETREGDHQFELSDDIGEPIPLDPPSLPFATDQGIDLTAQEPAGGDQMLKRPDGNWMGSAWVLIILLVIMIAAFLIYVATTDGKWPVIKSGEKKTKKKKTTK